ncbi:hypothetical protein FQZ97_212620 [compost metagenome]
MLAGAKDPDLRAVQLRGDFRPRHDQRAAAVGHHAAVQLVQRVRDHRRVEHVFHGHHVAQHRVRVIARVVRGGHLDPGQLLGRGAVLVHMAHGHHGVRVDGQRVVGGLEGQVGQVGAPVAGLGAAGAFGARTARQRDQRDVALAHGDCLRGMRHMRQVRGAAGFRGVDVADLQAEVVDHVQHAQARRVARAEIAVDVRQRQAGVFQCAFRAFGMQLGHGLVRCLAGRVLIGADDIGLAFDAHLGFLLVSDGEGRHCLPGMQSGWAFAPPIPARCRPA